MMRSLRVSTASVILALLGLVALACGDTELPVETNLEWAEPGILLGDWTGVRVEQRRQADPSFIEVVPDTFTLEVDTVGRYIARLVLTGAREDGWIRVEPPSVIFRPTNPPGEDDPGILTVRGDTIELVGDSSYDFGNGEEPSILEIHLIPRG